MKVGILALQGAFVEHAKIMNNLGVETFEIRQKKDIEKSFDAIILPGGESTTMGKLLKDLCLFEPIQNFIKNGMPVFGTCAGLILLAKEIANDDKRHIATLNVTVKRNAYGRQLGSFVTTDKFANKNIPMTFIRAPYIEKCGENVEILSVVDEKIVAVRQNNQLATAFHPELTNSTEVHQYFIEMIKNK
ncbi:MAG: pyridoxal 5'-phosphate synthase glutaminase subunit PdxT [Eubacteriales bacterium]|nr:pyridoxal 5'-phosphate synthase glutaminase subunit PdxT [Eubacteriales bacterium]